MFYFRLNLLARKVSRSLTLFQDYFNPSLGEGKRGRWCNFTNPPCWFFLNNSEMVKALTLEFCRI